MKIFLDDVDYRKFLYILGDVVDQYDIDCWDLCLMPNHYHLAVVNQEPNLPEAMQHLNGEYATWWNGRHGKVGHTFQGRYKDQIVQQEGYLMNLLVYIALNPVRGGLVTSPELWPWSAYQWIAGLSPSPEFMSPEFVLQQFGQADPVVLRERYMRHVLATRADDNERLQAIRSRARVLGDRQFKLELLRSLRPTRQTETAVAAIVAAGSAS